MDFGLVVPTLNAGNEWIDWIHAFQKQTIKPNRMLVIDSSSTDQTVNIAKESGLDIVVIERSEFDHGRTRQFAIDHLRDIEFCVFLTQDAILANAESLYKILEPFETQAIAAVCGRQLPRPGADPIEAHARLYNYSDHSRVSALDDAAQIGLKAAFLSNSFAAYRLSALREVGGFPASVIFGEDMYVAAKLLKSGYKIAYAADACVYHSHDFTILQELRRYFDMGVLHIREPWIISEFGKAEGEGFRFVASELSYLLQHAFWQIPEALLRTVVKYAAYRLGLMEARIPLRLKLYMSMNPEYFKTR